MTYEKFFLTDDEILALYAACAKLPFRRQKTVPWGQLRRHQIVSFSARPSARASYVGPHFTLAEAPQEVQQLAAKLSAHTGKDINYLSVVLYENGNDYPAVPTLLERTILKSQIILGQDQLPLVATLSYVGYASASRAMWLELKAAYQKERTAHVGAGATT